MSILRGASGSAAEVFFQLASASNPNNPVVGVDFTAGTYVYAWVPASPSFIAVPPAQIKEKGFGTYAVQLTGLQSAGDGTCYVFALVPGTSQPSRVQADIVDPLTPARRELPFVLMPLSDPVFDSGGLGLGHSFAPGEVQLRFSTDVAFGNASVPQIVERGFNMYAVILTTLQRANVNAALIAANVASMVPFVAEWDMIIDSFSGVSPTPPTPVPPPFIPPISTGPIDQVAKGLNRLALQYLSKVS